MIKLRRMGLAGYVESMEKMRNSYKILVVNTEVKRPPARPMRRWKENIRMDLRATGWTIGVLGFDFRRRLGNFLFTTASGTVLGPTQPPIQCVPRTVSLGKAAGAWS
jgi:hypothetical protein